MKTQISNRLKKIMTLVIITLSFAIGSFAQKSYSVICCDGNLKNLKNIAVELNLIESQLTCLLINPVETSKNNSISLISKSELLIEEDEDLKIESWMLSESHFVNNRINEEIFEEVKEESIPIEDWMLDETHFIPGICSEGATMVDQEEEMQVEDWMLDEAHFLSKNTKTKSGTGVN